MTARMGTASDHRVAVSLTFDFDAESAWIGSFKVETPSALSRGAYGAYEGVPRILGRTARRLRARSLSILL